MRLTRLEIFGFKSFVERFVLNFDRNRIGIVGPNGCGKSNIVDALRWVLGETYAKQLRGSVLEDLIFNGSETRRPLGMAEVIITIRPNAGWSDNLRLEELVEVTNAETAKGTAEAAAEAPRSAPESGSDPKPGNTGEASSNGEAMASAAFVVDEEMPASVESNGAQAGPAASGEAPQVVPSPTPLEIEDLESVVLPQVLREVPGLLNASEIQFTRRLYRSGESEYFINRVPCRLRDMIDVYRVIGLGARGLSIVQQGEIGQFISKKPIERRELLEEAAGISGFRNRMEVAQRKLERTAENMDRLRDIMEEVEKQVRVLKRQATRARERNELKAAILREDISLFRGKRVRSLFEQSGNAARLKELNEKFLGNQSALLNAESRQGELQAELEEFETLIADKRRKRDALQIAFERERERIQGLEVSRARTESERASCLREREQIFARRSGFGEELERLEARRIDLESRMGEAATKKEQAESALQSLQQDEGRKQSFEVDLSRAREAVPEELRQEIAGLEERVGRMLGVETDLKELERQNETKRRELDDARRKLHAAELQITSVDSEVNSLKKQLEALAEQMVRATGESSTAADDAGVSKKKVLLAGLRVPERAQRAVSAILGERSNYLVADDELQSARSFADRLRDGKGPSGRVGIIKRGIDGFEAQTAVVGDTERGVAASAERLMDVLSIEPELEGVVRSFLGQFIFVANIDEAISLAGLRSDTGASRWIVTANGEVFTPWGWYTTEGKGASFAFTRRIEEMETRRKDLEEERASHQERLRASEEEAARIVAAREALVVERRELSENDRRLSALHRQVLEIERKERDRMLAESRLRQEQHLREEREAQAALRSCVTEVAKLQQEIEFCGRRNEQVHEDDRRLQGVLESLASREAELERTIADLKQAIEAGMLLDGDMTIGDFQRNCEELDRELKELGGKREPVRLAIAELAADVSDARKENHRLEDEIRKLSLQEERHRLELEMQSEELKRQHPESDEVTLVLAEEVQGPLSNETEAYTELLRLSGETTYGERGGSLESYIQTAQESVMRLRKRLEREGEVDPQSIELYETEDARLRTMQEQYADLEEAKKILETTIRRLKEISRQRFLETFTAVNKKFQELIPRLFGGGAGHLELLNPDDPLASGVELMVRPPGKRLGSMELMSGGEKALVAISVMISMFLHRPSPICVLDEVDAPLDEANLERYLSVISEISRKTQFLVITHNKRTMAEADRLIGITMQEKGVSTALTVALEEAPAILENIPAFLQPSAN